MSKDSINLICPFSSNQKNHFCYHIRSFFFQHRVSRFFHLWQYLQDDLLLIPLHRVHPHWMDLLNVTSDHFLCVIAFSKNIVLVRSKLMTFSVSFLLQHRRSFFVASLPPSSFVASLPFPRILYLSNSLLTSS